jgi:polyribonucleotide nucleotidyltransferase
MAITKLTSAQLYRKCDPAKFKFKTTAELEERLSALGQDRAISAVELGINIKSRGYNLFCLGPEGTGKTSLVKRILEKEGKQRPTPDDWAYVYNFDEPHKPIAVNFAAGEATGFAKAMEDFVDFLEHELSEVVKSEMYEEQLKTIREKYQEKRNDYIKVLQKKAKGKKLEKWEQEFCRDHRGMVELKTKYTKEELAEQEKLKALLD